VAILTAARVLAAFAAATLNCTGPAVAAELAVGQPFPRVELQDAQGRSVSAGVGEAGIAVVEVWATWCQLCHEALPALLRTVQECGQGRVRLVLWNIDVDVERARRFLAERLVSPEFVVLRFDPGGRQFSRIGAPEMPVTTIVANGLAQAVFGGYSSQTEDEIRSILRRVVRETGALSGSTCRAARPRRLAGLDAPGDRGALPAPPHCPSRRRVRALSLRSRFGYCPVAASRQRSRGGN